MSIKQDKHNEQQGAPGAPVVLPESYYDDEISLIDLWCVLVKRKLLVLMTLVLALVLGVVYATMKPVLYSYSSVIEVGSLGQDKGLVEPVNNLLEKINRVYLPNLQVNEDQEYDLAVKPSLPKNTSNLIVLESTAMENKAKSVGELHDSLIERVIKEHKILTNVHRKVLETDRAKYELLLSEYYNKRVGLDLASQSINESLLMASMGLGFQNGLETELSRINGQLMTMKDTMVLNGVVRSQYPVGTGKRTIVVLSAVLGLMLGIFMAFFMEFLQRAKSSQSA